MNNITNQEPFPMFKTAQVYLQAGLRVFPISTASLRPLARWRQLQRAATTQSMEPHAAFLREGVSIAVICGTPSGNFEAIHFAPMNASPSGEAEQSMACRFANKVLAERPSLYGRLIWQEDSSGRHDALYRVDGAVGPSTCLIRANTGRALVETLGEGAYRLLAPSPGFKFLHGRGVESLRLITAEERDYLHQVAISVADPQCNNGSAFCSGDAGVGNGLKEDELDPGPFPVDALPCGVRAVVQNAAAAFRVPVVLPALTALGVLSIAAAKAFAVRDALPGVRTFLNLFMVVSAEKGSGKGRTAEALAQPLQRLQELLTRSWAARAAHLRARLRQLQGQRSHILKRASYSVNLPAEDNQKLSAIEDELPQIQMELDAGGQLLCEDVTAERLSVLMAANREFLGSVSSEGGVVVDMVLGRCKGRLDVDLYLKAYCGEPYRVERMTRAPVLLGAPRLALLWMVQGVVAEKLVRNAEVLARGFTSRCIIVDTGATREVRTEMPPAFSCGDQWNAIVEPIGQAWLELGDRPVQDLACTREAALVFMNFENEGIALERRFAGRIDGIDGELSRCRENATKIAGLLALAAGERERIDEATALRACKIMRFCLRSYLRLRLGGARAAEEREVHRLVTICGGPGGEIAFSELQRRHGVRGEKLERVRQLAQRHPRVLEVRERATRTKTATVLRAVPLEEGN